VSEAAEKKAAAEIKDVETKALEFFQAQRNSGSSGTIALSISKAPTLSSSN